MKYVWYVRGAMGDLYPALAMMGSIPKSDLQVLIDSSYHHNGKQSWEARAFDSLLRHGGITDYQDVPEEWASWKDAYGRHPYYCYSEQEMSVPFHCLHPTTRDQLMSMVDEETEVYSTWFPERTYDSRGNRVMILYDPISFDPVEQYDIVIHIRNKYDLERSTCWQAIIDAVEKTTLSYAVIGNPAEMDNIKCHMLPAATFERSISAAAQASFFIGSNSVYMYHRFYSGGGLSLILSPWHIGEPKFLLRRSHFENPKYYQIDSGKHLGPTYDLIDQLIEEVVDGYSDNRIPGSSRYGSCPGTERTWARGIRL